MKNWLTACVLLLSHAAYGQEIVISAPTVTAHTRQTLLSPEQYPPLLAQREGRNFTLGDGYDVSELATLHFTNIDSNSVEHQVVVQGAIGDGGQWGDLDSRAVSTWQKIPTTGPIDVSVVRVGSVNTEGFLVERVLRDEASVALTKMPMKFGTPQAREPGPGGAKLSECVDAQGKFDPNLPPCYTYLSEDRFRFRGKDGKSYLLTIGYEGGC